MITDVIPRLPLGPCGKQILEQHLEKDPTNNKILLYLGNIYYNIKNKNKAEFYYQQAIDNGNIYALILLADMFRQYGVTISSSEDTLSVSEQSKDEKSENKINYNDYYLKAEQLLEQNLTNMENVYYLGILYINDCIVHQDKKKVKD